MNPLDWTGPEFLKLYISVQIATLFLALIVRWWLRQPAGVVGTTTLENSPYECAYLAGGVNNATDAAIVRLIQRGALAMDAGSLRLSRKGDGLEASAHPLEQSVYQAVDAETGSLLARVRQSAAPSADKLRQRLDQLELLIPEARANLVRWLPTLLMAAVACFGFAKIVIGLNRHRPVGYLVVLVLITGVAAFVLLRLPCFRTRRGDQALEKLKRDNAALEFTAGRRSYALTDADLVMAVGLFGVGVLAGGPLGYLPTPMLALPPPRTGTSTSSSSCSSWFSCSSSSSCGGGGGGCGGGCGGGGCGGCGG